MKKVKKVYATRFCAKRKNLAEKRGSSRELLIVKRYYKLD